MTTEIKEVEDTMLEWQENTLASVDCFLNSLIELALFDQADLPGQFKAPGCPKIDVDITEDTTTIEATVPAASRETVSLVWADGMLKIKREKKG
jgi:hypothetical protein